MRIWVNGMGGTTTSNGQAIMPQFETVHAEEPSNVWHSSCPPDSQRCLRIPVTVKLTAQSPAQTPCLNVWLWPRQAALG
jgi:hypothetical protein